MQGESWFVAAGVAGSMAAGAVVLGYYLVYWIGVRRRYRRHVARQLRRMFPERIMRPSDVNRTIRWRHET